MVREAGRREAHPPGPPNPRQFLRLAVRLRKPQSPVNWGPGPGAGVSTPGFQILGLRTSLRRRGLTLP